MTTNNTAKAAFIIFAFSLLSSTPYANGRRTRPAIRTQSNGVSAKLAGRTETLLPDGHTLLVGGSAEDGHAEDTIFIKDPLTGSIEKQQQS